MAAFDALASLTGGGGLSAGGGGPSTAGLRSGDNSFDSSGWNVNFGAGSIDSTRGGEALGGYVPYIVAGLGLLIVWRMNRKR